MGCLSNRQRHLPSQLEKAKMHCTVVCLFIRTLRYRHVAINAQFGYRSENCRLNIVSNIHARCLKMTDVGRSMHGSIHPAKFPSGAYDIIIMLARNVKYAQQGSLCGNVNIHTAKLCFLSSCYAHYKQDLDLQ